MNRQNQMKEVHFSSDEEQAYFMGGQVEGCDFQRLHAHVRMLEILKEVKESRVYKAANRSGGTWAGYCKMVGFSARKVDVYLCNLDAVKEELEKRKKEMGLEGIEIG